MEERERERLELLEVGDHALGTRKESFIASRVRRQSGMEQEPRCSRNPEGWLLESCFARDRKSRERGGFRWKWTGCRLLKEPPCGEAWAHALDVGEISRKTCFKAE